MDRNILFLSAKLPVMLLGAGCRQNGGGDAVRAGAWC